MAHFAQLDENNEVINVVVVADGDTADADGNEVESIGVSFLQSIEGAVTNWVQTSYRTIAGVHPEGTPFRGHFAGIGMIYDAAKEVFHVPQPYPSFTLNDQGIWEPPVAHPGDGIHWWDEGNQSWVEWEPPDDLPHPLP